VHPTVVSVPARTAGSVMRTPTASAFPWAALEPVTRASQAVLHAGRRWVELAAEPGRLEAALAALLQTDVRLVVRKVDARSPSGPWVRLGVALNDSAMTSAVVGLEAPLAAALLAALLRRPIPLVTADAELDAASSGALTALVIEAARASGAALPLRPAAPRIAADAAVLHLTVILRDHPYAAALWVPPVVSPAPRPLPSALLARLGALPLTLPLVVGVCALTPRELAQLVAGAALCPGAGLWLDRAGAGRAVLVAGASELGLGVELEPGGRIVLRQAATVALAAAETTPMPSDELSDPPTLADAVLDAPVVVRIELGSVSMPAREWAGLKPGDVLGSGRRVAEPVLLRAAGRVLAEGELVNLEGELGVRVVRLLPDDSA
jgi:type III secretion system YscQ/HrcQ family protein